MTRHSFLISISLAAAALSGAACQSTEKTPANAANKSAAATVTNAPPEFSGKAANVANDPNAPKATTVERGATPIPGIPTDEELKKQQSAKPKKTPPIPGIPSEEELKRQMNTPISNQRINETKPPLYESNSAAQMPVDQRPRKVRKP